MTPEIIIGAGIGVLAVFIVMWDSWYGPYGRNRIRQQRQESESCGDKTTTPTGQMKRTEGALPQTSRGNTTTNDEHSDAKQTYWKRQVRAAERLNCITIIGAFVGVAGLVGIGASFFAAKRAADATGRQVKVAIASIRPWIDATVAVKDGLRISSGNPGMIDISLTFSYENVGKTPALHFIPYLQAVPYNNILPSGVDGMMFCNFYKNFPRQVDVIAREGITIFPGKTFTEDEHMFIYGSSITKALEEGKVMNGIMIEIDGCALYAMDGDDNVHSTPLYAILGRVSKDPRYNMAMFSVKGEVPQVFGPSDLALDTAPLGHTPPPN